MTLLDRILADDGLEIVFQPILELGPEGASLYGVECLSRGPQGTNVRSADVLFEYARRKHGEGEVDRAAIRRALTEGSRLPVPRLSVNVHASTIARDGGFPAFLEAEIAGVGWSPERVTLEIVEHLGCLDERRFFAAIAQLRALGVVIALDDLGVGFSNFRMILDSGAEVLKLDRYLIAGCQDDPQRCAILEALALFAERTRCRLLAEGVEEPAELATASCFGIDLFQGYLISRPLTADALVALLREPHRLLAAAAHRVGASAERARAPLAPPS